MKLATVENPISGSKGEITSGQYWFQNILGVMFFLIVVNIGQKVANFITGKTNTGVRAGLDTPITGSAPAPAGNGLEVF